MQHSAMSKISNAVDLTHKASKKEKKTAKVIPKTPTMRKR